MITLRKSKDRGHSDHGWLNTFHSFSFAEYTDPNFKGFHSLRVINEDFIAGGRGFGTHAHRDMEIITYLISGELAHKDSMGNGSVIHTGDMQYMSAGSGVEHSEFNPSPTIAAHLLQIWIFPTAKGLKPRYDQRHFTRESKLNQLRLMVSGDADPGLIQINQDANVYSSILESAQSLKKSVPTEKQAWIQLISGKLELNGHTLEAGDGAAISEEKELTFQNGNRESEFLLFELKGQ